ncbi:pentatricopeptide repeat-containing protein [Tanacetum coccineum]
MPQRNVVSYSALMAGFYQIGYDYEVLRLFKMMGLEGNEYIFATVFSACGNVGEVVLGRQCHGCAEVFGAFEVIGFVPYLVRIAVTYNLILGWALWRMVILGEGWGVGEENVVKLFLDMQREDVVPNESTFSVLLNASAGLSSLGYGYSLHAFAEKTGFRGHKNVGNALINMYSKTGEIEAAKNFFLEVADIIMGLDPDDVGTYTLLSNMHAKDFVEIHEKLKELFGKIKGLGYVPDTCNVLHDVEDEQKEDSVGYHSEKLAVAYALLKTHKGALIRIIKNLRICDDCHSFMKLVSKVTNRLINVRDANRFHHFQDGSCSCADYWYKCTNVIFQQLKLHMITSNNIINKRHDLRDAMLCLQQPHASFFLMVNFGFSQLQGIKGDMEFCLKVAKEEFVIFLVKW